MPREGGRLGTNYRMLLGAVRDGELMRCGLEPKAHA